MHKVNKTTWSLRRNLTIISNSVNEQTYQSLHFSMLV